MAPAPLRLPESSRGRESAHVPARSQAAHRLCSLSISAAKSMFRVSSRATQTQLRRAHVNASPRGSNRCANIAHAEIVARKWVASGNGNDLTVATHPSR
eukprot:7307936-Pyramimonas_sp.AAC.1